MTRSLFRFAVIGAVVAAGCAVYSTAWADPYPPVDQKRPPLVIAHHGIFYAGGTIRTRTQQGTETSGSVQVPIAGNLELVNQVYVEYYIPQSSKGPAKPPIFMVPGGGLISVHYLTTPDGREGWADYFLRLGYPVYMIDPPGRGRAGWSVDQYNDFITGASLTRPPLLGRSDSSQWLEWNTGPTFGVLGPHDPSCTGDDNRGTLHIYCNGDQMANDPESLKHWLGALVQTGPFGGGNDAYIAAVQKIMAYHKSKVIYLGHSAGGSTGGVLANAHPELFAALIALEPASGCPFTGTLDQLAGLKQVPLLSLHGINQVGRPTTPGCLDAYDAINQAGGDATFFSLLLLPNDPRFPFYSRIPLSNQIDDWGTDHLMFWDASSDKVAGVIANWLDAHVVKTH